MDQLELVFQLLVHLQFMYFQYNMYLSIVVRTNISKTILGHPSWRALPASWGVKNGEKKEKSTPSRARTPILRYTRSPLNHLQPLSNC